MSGLRVTLRWVAEAVGGRVAVGDPETEIGRVCIDTRTLQAGDFFVALRGVRFDAHEFVGEAMAKGAMGALVERGFVGRAFTARQDFALVEAADTTKALQELAHAVRMSSGTRVIAITGSAGKTTTKETIAEFLSRRLRVVKNTGNLNNHIGLPLSLMQLKEAPDVAVMELGMNHAGEISTLVAIAEPEMRVWTNVGDAHLGFFASPEAIADAKAEVLERARPDHVLVCNADDPRVMARVGGFAGRTLTFGTAEGATVRAREVEDLGVDGMRALVTTPAGERRLQTPLLGRGNLFNVLAAAAVALDFGVPLDEIVAAAARSTPAERRGHVRRLRGGVTLIDDSYNSSPTALRGALEVVARETRVRRKVAVLGEMLELGGHSLRLHADCGRAAAASGLRLLFVIGGGPARALGEAAVAAGMPASAVVSFETSEAAAPAVAAAVRAGDLVLVKGSRAVRTDLVADRIAAELA
ncbi:MAG: UDP-N-acetylmuramoyl-tripeptide--D-alanyl-D-alanine ligase [Acidobacteria bacterium]|nr:UDP-N-acetylmuramoyl-tripeptide--D-alanyl-D-alanine ligase [Acidobacteriota bacterium]